MGTKTTYHVTSGKDASPCFCCCSVAKLYLVLCDLMGRSTPGFSVLYYLLELLKLMSIELVMLSNHLFLCCPLLLPSIFPRIRIFSNELAVHIRWPKNWTSSFRTGLPMNIQCWFPLGFTGLILLNSKGFSRVFSSTAIGKHRFFSAQSSLWLT